MYKSFEIIKAFELVSCNKLTATMINNCLSLQDSESYNFLSLRVLDCTGLHTYDLFM
jgi:hypothetical protein